MEKKKNVEKEKRGRKHREEGEEGGEEKKEEKEKKKKKAITHQKRLIQEATRERKGIDSKNRLRVIEFNLNQVLKQPK